MNASRTFAGGAAACELVAERWVPAKGARAHVVFVHGLGEHRRAPPYVPVLREARRGRVRGARVRPARPRRIRRRRASTRGTSTSSRRTSRRVIALAADEARRTAGVRDRRQLRRAPRARRGAGAARGARRRRRRRAGARRERRLEADAPAAARVPDGRAARAARSRPRPHRARARRRRRSRPTSPTRACRLGKITPSLAAATLAGIERVIGRADDVDLPLLLMHGLADRIVPPDGTLALPRARRPRRTRRSSPIPTRSTTCCSTTCASRWCATSSGG